MRASLQAFGSFVHRPHSVVSYRCVGCRRRQADTNSHLPRLYRKACGIRACRAHFVIPRGEGKAFHL